MAITVVDTKDNPLLTDLIKFANQVRDKQRYLEMQANNPNPNYEAGATPAETVKMIGDELDKLIARMLLDHKLQAQPTYCYNSRIWGALKAEYSKRRAQLDWMVQLG